MVDPDRTAAPPTVLMASGIRAVLVRSRPDAPTVWALETADVAAAASSTRALRLDPAVGETARISPTVAYHLSGIASGVLGFAGAVVVWWLAGGRLVDITSPLQHDLTGPWHWRPIAAAFVALIVGAICSSLDVAASRALGRRRRAQYAAIRHTTVTSPSTEE